MWFVNSGSSKCKIGALRPRAMDNALSWEVAFGFTTILFPLTGWAIEVAFFFAFVILPSVSTMESKCKYSGNNSVCNRKRRKFSLALSPSLLIKINCDCEVPKLYAQFSIANADWVLPCWRGKHNHESIPWIKHQACAMLPRFALYGMDTPPGSGILASSRK